MAVFSSGLGLPEGPFPMLNGDWLVVEMASDRGCVTRIAADGMTLTEVVRTGRPNAVVLDGSGNLWIAESYPTPSILHVTPAGRVLATFTRCADLDLLFPNDLVFGPDGLLYFTDSGISLDEWAPGGRIRADYRTAEIDGRVFRLDPASGESALIDRAIAFANGIAVNPEGDLFVNEMITGEVFRYPWNPASGLFGPRCRYSNVMRRDEGLEEFAGPDGMRFSADGRLFCTVYGAGRVAILAAGGEVLGSIHTEGRFPTNVSLGRDGSGHLIVTECEFGRLERFEVAANAGPLYEP